VGQLHSGYASLFMNKTNDSIQHLDVLVVPDAEILGTDASLGKNGGCLSQNEAGATHRATPEMNEMPIVGVSIVTRVLTHRRDEHPIGKRQISNRERIKQAGHGHRSVTRTERMSKVQFKSLPRGCGKSLIAEFSGVSWKRNSKHWQTPSLSPAHRHTASLTADFCHVTPDSIVRTAPQKAT
jgi:hypothetical protein